jgi:quercetin dioxygenase-like cupin family protein
LTILGQRAAQFLTVVKTEPGHLCDEWRMSETKVFRKDSDGIINLNTDITPQLNGIVSKTLLQTDGMRVVLFAFDSGQELTEHTSPSRALVQILAGECEFKLGQSWHSLHVGDLVHMPPELPHAVRATTRFSMLLTLTPAEMRLKPLKENDEPKLVSRLPKTAKPTVLK